MIVNDNQIFGGKNHNTKNVEMNHTRPTNVGK